MIFVVNTTTRFPLEITSVEILERTISIPIPIVTTDWLLEIEIIILLFDNIIYRMSRIISLENIALKFPVSIEKAKLVKIRSTLSFGLLSMSLWTNGSNLINITSSSMNYSFSFYFTFWVSVFHYILLLLLLLL